MISYRAALLAAACAFAAPPAMALDTPSPSAADARLRSVVYDPDNVVQLFATPGATVRIRLGIGERVVAVLVSDQGTIRPEEEEPEEQGQAAGNAAQQAGGPNRPSCDRNLCRTVHGNFVYLMPRRELQPQPLFVQTEWCAADGHCEPGEYAFELRTRGGDINLVQHAQNNFYGIAFSYPQRQAQLAARQRAKAIQDVRSRPRPERPEPPASPSVPEAAANWRYAVCGAAAISPDEVWDDGRTTFLRFLGQRRIPNVYTYLPDGTETIANYTVEPQPAGSVLRLGKTAARWILRDGDRAACLVNMGPDPDGRLAMLASAEREQAPRPRRRRLAR